MSSQPATAAAPEPWAETLPFGQEASVLIHLGTAPGYGAIPVEQGTASEVADELLASASAPYS